MPLNSEFSESSVYENFLDQELKSFNSFLLIKLFSSKDE